MSDDEPLDASEVVEEIITKMGRERAEHEAAQEQARRGDAYVGTDGGVRVSEQFQRFIQNARDGKLPDPGDVPEVDPEVRALLEELHIVHLPEWRNPAGRKLADPTVVRIPQSPRLAQYLVDRGWVRDPAREKIRWAPTPGGLTSPFDTGLHYGRDESGEWPVIDPEAFWDIDDIKTEQLPGGEWSATHPRGIAFTAGSKSEAHAGLVERIRAKIVEAREQQGSAV